MYAQGNQNPQPGQGPQKPMSSPYQQCLPGPPPLPQFQQGPSSFTFFPHGPAAPRQIPPGGRLPSTGQFYPYPPLHVHAGASLPHLYPTAQQNSQHNSHLGSQNSPNMPQSMLPPIRTSHPEVSQTQPPSRALPPPPTPPPPPPQSQGQVFYGASVNPPQQRPGLQHLSSHPPFPATTSFFTSAPLGSFIHSTSINLHTAPLPPPPPPPQLPPSLPLPPPPSSPLPIQPSPPPSTSIAISSSKPAQNDSSLPCNLDNDGSKLSASGSMDEAVTPNQANPNLIAGDDSLNKGEGNACNVGFMVGDKLSLQEGLTVDVSSPPHKPTNKNVIERIKDEQQHDSSLRPSEKVPSEQHCPLVIAAASHSPGDSDMEMEDDITQIEDQGMNHSSKGLSSQCDINNNMLSVEEQLYFHPVQMSTDGNANKDILSEKESAVGSSRLVKEDPEGIANTDQMAFSASVSKIISVKSTVPAKQPLVTSLEKSNTSSQLAKSDCPFRLIQDYASDDNLENVEVGSSADSDKLRKESKLENENMTLGSQHKLDKFGRLIRDGARDSDSDDSCDIGRYRRGKPRSRKQSHSPLDRRRRSTQRRRKKRSLSRSWSPRNGRSRSRSPRNGRSRSRSPRNRRSSSRSPRYRRSMSRSPRNRRSRSRSPSFQHTDEFSGEKKRRVKGQMPSCFDFRRGKCYRGVSCRYLHHDSGKSYESRGQRSKQYLELPHTSRTNNAHEEIKQSSENREDSGDGGVHYEDIQSNEYHMVKSDRSRDIPASLFETHLLEKKQEGPNPVSHENCQEAGAEYQNLSTIDSSSVGNMDTLKSCANASQKVPTSFSGSLNPVCQNANSQPQQSDNSSMSDSLPCKTSTSSLNRLPESNVHPHAMELHNHPGHISSPSVLCSHGKDNPHTKEKQTSSSMFQPSGESFPSYMLPNQEAYFALQPNSSMTSLPPPPPPLPPPPPSLDSTVTPSVSSHFQQSYFPPRNVFGSQIIPRPYLTELPACSQSDGVQQRAYPPTQDVNQPILQASLPVCNLPGPPSISRDDGLTQPPMHNVIASNSFSQGNIHPHTLPCSQQLLGNKMQPFSSESLPPSGVSYSSPYIHPFAQQQPPHSSLHPTIDGFYNLGGRMNSSLKVPPNIGDTSSYRVDIGGSSSSIPNTNASTFVQPMNTKHNSDILRQEKDIAYNKTPFSLAHDPVHGRGIGSQQATFSPNSSRAFGQNFLRTGGDQYDPLFDSIEPSSSLSRKNSCIQKLEVTGDSDILLGISGSNKPLNVGENNQRKDAAAAASVASAGNEEFGETADGEVGAVESGSPSNPAEINMATSEIEIDQIKSPGKSKKSKDSRSMKHFKVALARFVKELLKPSWRQGNMSNEVFKTIVKKTVDKVSGAMKSHHIPKSRAKIDRYIESSQQKLTKLVTGYVNKYVNV
ncbi:hypothetical protein HRI_003192600 [Hibiscus trionum]|uniref:C3H1-type domain-containing protein n=1 Tax=Hibiscus trionum TaxID=183268 RepID=A0A9W7IH39_HIBTR|nr:hypothetical protein HRI_003192600 [Hibiscus trionum]